MRNHRKIVLSLWLSLGVSLASAQAPSWVNLSGGQVYTVLCEGSSRVLVGTQTGIAISADGGKSWPISGIYKPVHALTIDHEGRIYAGSEKGIIYVSNDGGETWTTGSTGSRATFNRVCVDQGGIVYASAEGYGIYASTDHGATWHEAGFSGISVFAVAVNSHNRLFAVRYGGGLYQSSDGGATWTKTSLASTTVRTLALGPHDEIYAGVLNDGIWLSTDSGATWAPRGLSGINTTCLVTNQAGVPYAATASALLMSAVGDTTWTPVQAPWATQVAALAFAGDTTLYAVTGGEIYVRAGAGSWAQYGFETRGRTANALYVSASQLIAASGQPGLLASDVGGIIWRLQDTTLSKSEIRSFAGGRGGPLFAGTGDARILISRDSARHWAATAFAANSPLVFTLAVDADGHLFAGTLGDGIHRSSDDGAQWNALNAGIGNLFVRALLPFGDNRLLAGTDGGLFLSSDGGLHWSSLPVLAGMTWSVVRDRNGVLYAGTDEKGLFRSTDQGNSWSPSNSGLTCLNVRCIAVDINGHLTAGTFGGGVFQSTNAGMTWAPMNSGLTDPDVTCLTFGQDGFLYAGTRRNWVFRTSLTPLVNVAERSAYLPTAAELQQNWPNPFNPSTVIQYTVGGAGVEGRGVSVRLVVYDMLGREVTTLVNEMKAPGSYEATFDAGRLASGVYLYRITAGPYTQSKKMLLLK